MRVHYPRTPHLPWSPGAAADDVRTGDVSGLAGAEVVVTEKMDGENTTLYPDGLHARSLDSAHHPSRAWVKGLQNRVGARIPDGWRICGENLFARHSIPYTELDSWFYGFSVWTDQDHCLDWDATVRFLRRLGVPTPRVLWRGRYDERALRALRLDLDRQEGYVVRTVRGFPRGEFGERVAKWVRPQHVRTDTHWMHAAVVENGLGPDAALWDVRSGRVPELPLLAASLGLPELGGYHGSEGQPEFERHPEPDRRAEELTEELADVSARLDELGRTGDARLAGVLATALRTARRESLAPRLADRLGLPLARRVADLVGLQAGLQQPYPDAERRTGLVRLASAADLGVLHAVAAAAAPGPAEREQVAWSALHAEDAGLLGADPLAWLRTGLREALADLAADSPDGPDAADRCWAQAREAYALGRISTVEEAVAATWRWRDGRFPRLVHLSGPSGSGKSTFSAALPGVSARISLDDLRAARGSRADQRNNPEVLRTALARLDGALAEPAATVVWDATSLNREQRSHVHGTARRRDALLTQVVLLVGEQELLRRNAVRLHPVPPEVLTAQLHRYSPPYPGQAHRTWYVGPGGTVEDTAGSLDSEED
ncbi:RNA ligase family protein [Kitasatospora sp. NPDC058162]|uniref:RNA ligase family protein n=1 Tax=Kitasatospora sp. NPDC058162 TaxID=3346362 RepID=UPI0036DCB767